MTEHTIYKHRFIFTVLSEDDVRGYALSDLTYAVTSGPDLGWLELESFEKITDRKAIIQECQACRNDGSYFTEMWDELDELGDD